MVQTTDLWNGDYLPSGGRVREARIDLRISELSKDQVVGLMFRHTLERMVSLGLPRVPPSRLNLVSVQGRSS